MSDDRLSGFLRIINESKMRRLRISNYEKCRRTIFLSPCGESFLLQPNEVFLTSITTTTTTTTTPTLLLLRRREQQQCDAKIKGNQKKRLI